MGISCDVYKCCTYDDANDNNVHGDVYYKYDGDMYIDGVSDGVHGIYIVMVFLCDVQMYTIGIVQATG